MNSTREIVCFDCENAIYQYEKSHSPANLLSLYKDYNELTKEIDGKILALKDRMNAFRNPRTIEEIYQNLEKRNIIKILITKQQPHNPTVREEGLASIHNFFVSSGFMIYHLFTSPSVNPSGSYSYIPFIYNQVTYPSTAVLTLISFLQPISSCVVKKILPVAKVPRLAKDDELIKFFRLLHKVDNAKFFNEFKTEFFLQEMKTAYEQLSTEDKDRLLNRTDLEKEMSTQLSNISTNHNI